MFKQGANSLFSSPLPKLLPHLHQRLHLLR
jgi:hypothetical protein